ncbi:hypothetical protein ACFL5V_01680 [Fibrobacterota bacterium]
MKSGESFRNRAALKTRDSAARDLQPQPQQKHRDLRDSPWKKNTSLVRFS